LGKPQSEEETRKAELSKAIADLSAIGDSVIKPVMDKIRLGDIPSFQHRAVQVLGAIGTPQVCFNPHFLSVRLNSDAVDYCGDPRSHAHTNTVIHEARHCYQDYLSSQDLGQTDDIAGKPNNDDDQDWLVETVPIGPTNYILDTNSPRNKCSGTDSFSGDATYDNYTSGGTRSTSDNVIEKDAATYAENND